MEEEIRGKSIYDLELTGTREEIICRTTEGFEERAWWGKQEAKISEDLRDN
jgi:hypothetical protein